MRGRRGTATLRIRLFGGLEVTQGTGAVLAFPTARSEALFAFLALHGHRGHHRDALAEMFCGADSASVARRRLRCELWRIRRVLEPDARQRGRCLLAQGALLRFNREADYWLDVEVFANKLAGIDLDGQSSLPGAHYQRLEEGVGIYRGDLLVGLEADWCTWERERLRDLHRAALERLIRHHRAKHETRLAIQAGHRLLTRDPLLEHVHRDLMRMYVSVGNRPAALRQFKLCNDMLRRELHLEPTAETMRLYEGIRSARPQPHRRARATHQIPPATDRRGTDTGLRRS